MTLDKGLDKILIIDFGSQFTQLIARRIREFGVFSEIISHKKIKNKDINEMLVKSTILHGKLTELVKEAKDPKGEKGVEISALEKKDIFDCYLRMLIIRNK